MQFTTEDDFKGVLAPGVLRALGNGIEVIGDIEEEL